jgi:hypothetical protein
MNYAWNSQRIKFREEYTKELHLRITDLKNQLDPSSKSFTHSNHDFSKLDNTPPTYGDEKCGDTRKRGATKEESEELIRNQIQCYEGAERLSKKFLEDSVKVYVENVFIIRVPFFGVVFDINDLGAIGGLSLIVILTMLRLNLRNFIVSLRIGFKAARKANSYEDFYDTLAARQLFAFPSLEDPEQNPYKGMTERIWRESRAKRAYEIVLALPSWSFNKAKKALWAIFRGVLFSRYKEAPRNTKSDEKTGWYSNPHPLLTLVPIWICLVPSAAYATVVLNDFLSLSVGLAINPLRTITGFALSLFCFVAIFGLGCWCVSKWIEIDELWKEFDDGNPSRQVKKEITSAAFALPNHRLVPGRRRKTKR